MYDVKNGHVITICLLNSYSRCNKRHEFNCFRFDTERHSKKYKTCSYNVPSHRKTPCSLLRPLQRMSLVEKPVVKSSQKKSLLLYQDKTFVVVPAALALPRLDPHLPFSMQLDALQPHNFVKHLPTQPISSELQMDTNLLVRPELFI